MTWTAFIKLLKAILLQSTAGKEETKTVVGETNDGLRRALALVEQPENACLENIQFHVLRHQHAYGLICY